MIRKLVKQMLSAQIFSALAVSLCLLIDNIMIGRFLKEPGMASYSLANPLLLSIGAIGTLLSAGVQVACGKSLGSGSKEETNAGYSSAVAFAAAVSLLFTAVVLVFSSFLSRAMGAGRSGELFDMTRGYLIGFAVGAPGSMGALVLIPFLQMAGQGNLLIAAVLTMTVTDVGLDLLNGMVLHWGMFGMGLASSVSYYAAIAVVGWYFLSKKCVFRFSPKQVTLTKIAELFRGGIPAGFNTALISEIGKRLHINIKSVNIDSGSRTIALMTGRAQVVFWTPVLDNVTEAMYPDGMTITEIYHTEILSEVKRRS